MKLLNECLAALKFIPDWFVTSKIIKNLYTDLYADENTICFLEDSGDAVFSCSGIGILSIDLNNINLDDVNYDEDDPETIILVRLLAWHSEFKKRKALKKR